MPTRVDNFPTIGAHIITNRQTAAATQAHWDVGRAQSHRLRHTQPLEQLGKLKPKSLARAEKALQEGERVFCNSSHVAPSEVSAAVWCGVVAVWPRGGNSISDRRKPAMIAAV